MRWTTTPTDRHDHHPQHQSSTSAPPPPTPGPQSPVADPLLQDFLTNDLGLLTLAARHALSLDQLEAWLTSDATQRTLATIERLAAIRARAVAAQAAPLATTRLLNLTADPTTPPETARKAATTLLRAHRVPSPPPRPAGEVAR
ncbi:MAG: hypothetical protein AAF356_05950, partial [Planctomycetota bacterium]